MTVINVIYCVRSEVLWFYERHICRGFVRFYANKEIDMVTRKARLLAAAFFAAAVVKGGEVQKTAVYVSFDAATIARAIAFSQSNT